MTEYIDFTRFRIDVQEQDDGTVLASLKLNDDEPRLHIFPNMWAALESVELTAMTIREKMVPTDPLQYTDDTVN